MVDEAAKPLFIIFEKSWLPRELSIDWKSGNITPTFRKGQKEELGICLLASLTSVPGKGAVGYCCFHVNRSPLSYTPIMLLFILFAHRYFQQVVLLSTCDLYLFMPPGLLSILPQEEGERGSKQVAHSLKRLSGSTKLGSIFPKPQQLGSTAQCPNGEH